MNAFAVGFRAGLVKAAKARDGASRVTSAERARFAELHRASFTAGDGCSLGRDDKGLYVYTHRARSPSYASVDAIPVAKVKFIAGTA